jgi:hypothetical protein
LRHHFSGWLALKHLGHSAAADTVDDVALLVVPSFGPFLKQHETVEKLGYLARFLVGDSHQVC